MDAVLAFLNWQFIAGGLCVFAIMATLKRVTRNVRPDLLDKGWFKAVMDVSNLFWGLVLAAVPGFLFGATFAERIIVGVGCGFLSHLIYRFFKTGLKARAGAADEKSKTDDVDSAP